MKVRFQDMLQRITGISTPFFGVSWNPSQVDRDVVKHLLAFLEDRRALYYPYEQELPSLVEESVHDIRRELSDALGKVERDSVAGEAFTLMRRACREFLDEVEGRATAYGLNSFEDEAEYFMALGKLRGLFGIQVARLSVAYGIDIEDELAYTLPPPPENEKTLGPRERALDRSRRMSRRYNRRKLGSSKDGG